MHRSWALAALEVLPVESGKRLLWSSLRKAQVLNPAVQAASRFRGIAVAWFYLDVLVISELLE